MFAAIADCRQLHRSLSLAVLAAFTLIPVPAAAEIVMRDDGAGGVVFSNQDEAKAAPPSVKAGPKRRAAPVPARPAIASSLRRQQLAPLVNAAADNHGLPEALLQAVIEVESNFNAGAVSPKGALGLMQLMPQTARHLGVADALDPAANIDGGARYLKQLLARFGNNLPLALAAYNAGPGAVQRKGAIPEFAETQQYVPRVILRYHSLQSGGLAPLSRHGRGGENSAPVPAIGESSPAF
jgi:soluble lytic murein transglycosylase-like protein